MRRSSDEEQYKADNKKEAYFHPTCIVIVGIKVLATLIPIKLLKINKYPESNTRRGTPYGKVTKAQENTTHKRATMSALSQQVITRNRQDSIPNTNMKHK